ncbi:hypothetical protein VPMS16_3537 [Vibrio sp. 16]|nr:hypothetical protein VPMS16_3537 [Vibrio sp. 16]
MQTRPSMKVVWRTKMSNAEAVEICARPWPLNSNSKLAKSHNRTSSLMIVQAVEHVSLFAQHHQSL